MVWEENPKQTCKGTYLVEYFYQKPWKSNMRGEEGEGEERNIR
jgi:hypothetical protein